MKEIAIKNYIRYLFGIAIFTFILNKFYLRPWVVEKEFPEFLQIIVFSIPNLIEAIVGTLILMGILFQLREHFIEKVGGIKNSYINLIAVIISSIYVISQELKFHNIGGNNVYDFYDLIASVIGLIGTFGIIQFFGFVKKTND